MNGISGSESLETLVARFHGRDLPRREWTHRVHLGVALWTLQRFPFEAALKLLRSEIQSYNESIGLANDPFSGYHETLTQFYARAVAAFLKHRQHEATGSDELWAQLQQQWGDKNAIFTYYSRRHLFSPRTRAEFTPPDLRPLDF